MSVLTASSAPGRKRLLMACTHDYEASMQVGSQHIARQFLNDGWDVAYLSSPVTPLHLLKKPDADLRRRWRKAFNRSASDERPSLREFTPFAWLAPDGRWPLNTRAVVNHWQWGTWPSLSKRLTSAGFGQVDLLYIDNIFYRFLLDEIAFRRLLFRVMDRHDCFPGWAGRTDRLAGDLARRADCVVYSTQGLAPYVAQLQPRKQMLVRNGVDFSLFEDIAANARAAPESGPVAVYVGAIDRRVDLAILDYAARHLPHVRFLMIGPVMEGVRIGDLPSNVEFRGAIAHHQLRSVFATARVGLIPFDVLSQTERLSGVLPLKLFEYLAAGLHVVSARWDEIEQLGSPAVFYEDPQGCVEALERALALPLPAEAASGFAKRHDWSDRYQLLLKSVGLEKG